MLTKGIKIGKIFGIEVDLDWTLFILIFLFGWAFSSYFIKLAGNPALGWFWGFVFAFGLVLSVLVHELSHSLVARRFKVYVKKITLFVLGGMAHLEGHPPSPKAEFWLTLAGPASSFALGGIFWLAAYLLSFLGSTNPWVVSLIGCSRLLGLINIILGGFNLFIPGFPLDGGRILRATLWKIWGDLLRATKWASRIGQGFAYAFVAFGFYQMMFRGNLGGLWLIFIGFILRNAAKAEYEELLRRERLSKTKVEKLLVEFPTPKALKDIPSGAPTCKKDDSLESLLKKMEGSSHPFIFVVEDDKAIGMVTREQIEAINQG